MEEIELSWWLFVGRLRQCKNVLPDGLNWLCYFAGSSKSHRENSISFIFLDFPHQVDMKNVVQSSKHFFGYLNTLETHSALACYFLIFNWLLIIRILRMLCFDKKKVRVITTTFGAKIDFRHKQRLPVRAKNTESPKFCQKTHLPKRIVFYLFSVGY
jgi:hypothetical protein